MKAKRKITYPMTIEITLETEKEAKTLYHLFNQSFVNDVLKPLNNGALRETIGHELHDHDFSVELWKKIKEAVK